MTTTPGPIPLTVVTLYCRTTEAVCRHYRDNPEHDFCNRADLFIYAPKEQRVRTPPWCPLAGKETMQ